jgi:hypothetical protein
MQLHIEQGQATIYSKNGTDYTKRFRVLRDTIESIPAKSAIIDCELVACDDTGLPNFRADGDGQRAGGAQQAEQFNPESGLAAELGPRRFWKQLSFEDEHGVTTSDHDRKSLRRQGERR